MENAFENCAFWSHGAYWKYLIEEVLASGHQVLVYGSNASRIRLTDNNVTLVIGQIHDSATVAKALEGVDAFISTLGQVLGARREL
jgi:putative NADH-flavin reductase